MGTKKFKEGVCLIMKMVTENENNDYKIRRGLEEKDDLQNQAVGNGIVYKKDANGNLVTDVNGNPIILSRVIKGQIEYFTE